MKAIAVASVALILASGALAQPPETEFELFDSALSQVGYDRTDLRFDESEVAIYGGYRWRLNYFSLFHRDPLKLPRHGALNLETLSADAANITRLTAFGSRMIDHPIRRSLIGDPLDPYVNYPDTIPRPSLLRSKNVLRGVEYDRLREGVDLIYRLADDDDFLLKRGLKDVNKKKYRERLFDYFIGGNEERQDEVYEIVEKVDFDYLLAGAQDFVEAAKRLANAQDSLVFPEQRREIETGKGLIVIGSTGDDLYEFFTPPLIIVDGGGNDTYRYSGYPDKYPATIVIDMKGNDLYQSIDSTLPGIGGAVLGVAILIDRDGDDTYEGLNVAQGAALFGVGLLADNGGNDTYTGRSFTQGAATFGLGILVDGAGEDSLFCLSESQGYGYTRGCGLLLDAKGNDRYVADDENIVNASPQTEEHNASLAQGVGFGKRADYLDGHSWAGGVGILCDLAGDDVYSAGLFAQGCAYWHAVGMLLDGGGADRYNGVWYVQGAGAHFGVGYLDDFGGDDTYTASLNMAVGAGHDFTIGYLNERSGNDSYSVPNLSLGGGNASGIGIFHDHSGDDTYTTKGGTTLGRANSYDRGARKFLNCFGVFIDGGGADSYSEPWATNGSRWRGPQEDTTQVDPNAIGVGLDR